MSQRTGSETTQPESVSTGRPILRLGRGNLEAARLKAIDGLAATDGAFHPDALLALATLQMALTALREEIGAHGPRLRWGGNAELD